MKKDEEYRVRIPNNCMGDLRAHFFLFLKETFMFKSHLLQSNHRFLSKNKVYTYRAPVFAPDFSTAVLAAKICTNSHEHSMYIRF